MQAQRKRGRKPGTPKTGGRKKNTPNKATLIAGKRRAEIVAKAVEQGITPLEVMLENMAFARNGAAKLLSKMIGGKPEVDHLRELMSLRKIAQECARDAAPYVHAKLASIDVNGSLDVTLKTHEQAIEEMEKAAAAARDRRSA